MANVFNVILSQDRLIVDIRPETAQLLGGLPEDLLGSHAEQWLMDHPLDDAWCDGTLDEPNLLIHLIRAKHRPHQPLAARVVGHNSKTLSLHITALPLKLGDEALRLSFTDLNTITRAIQARTPELRESFEDTPDAITIFDWSTGYAIDANRASLELFQGENADIQKTHMRKFCAEEPHIVDRLIAALYRDGQISGHWSLRGHNGAVCLCRLHVVRFRDIHGEPRCVSIARPVAASGSPTPPMEDAERLLLQTDRFATLGQLALGIVHEVNNPASWIMGNLQLLQGMVVNLPKEEAAEAKEMIEESLEGMKRITVLTRALSRYGRPRTGSVSVFAASELIDDALHLTHPLIEQRAQLEVDSPKGMTLEGERGDLVHMLVNLLQNAAQAIPEGNPQGNVVRVRVWSTADRIHFDISDTGKGIPVGIQHKIFLPLFTTRTDRGGFGLGLTSCLDIVQRHSGKLTFETGSHGTLFRVALPALLPSAD